MRGVTGYALNIWWSLNILRDTVKSRQPGPWSDLGAQVRDNLSYAVLFTGIKFFFSFFPGIGQVLVRI